MLAEERLEESAARDSLRRIFDAAIDSAAPAPAVLANLPEKPAGRCVIIGAGKASAAMAAAIDSAWPDVQLSGVVSTRYGHAVPAGRISVIEAGHPVPDRASELAARRILHALNGLSADDLVIALISGGGSATMALPVESLSLEEKQQITRQLLSSGAAIGEINTVREHLSLVKGGKLAAAAAPARLLTLLISDVPGDNPASVASGPTIPSGSAPADALAVLDRYGVFVSRAVRQYLESAEPPTSSDASGEYRIIASPAQALKAAAGAARELGFTTVILGDSIEGESRELGRVTAGIAKSVRTMGEPARAPVVLLSGGETTVTIGSDGAGRGGRNMEFLLSLALELNSEPGIWALAGDSDGIDGTDDAAGAFIGPDTLKRAFAAGIDPREALIRHDSYVFFSEIGDLIRTGPTLTNVNDIRIVMIADQR
jgi:hydroxypyruvate reductase